MVEIKLKHGQSGYDAVGEYIHRYWKNNMCDTVIISIAISRDNTKYWHTTEVATPYYNDIEFLNDWWEGERFIKIFGIKSLQEIDVDGGIYSQ